MSLKIRGKIHSTKSSVDETKKKCHCKKRNNQHGHSTLDGGHYVSKNLLSDDDYPNVFQHGHCGGNHKNRADGPADRRLESIGERDEAGG